MAVNLFQLCANVHFNQVERIPDDEMGDIYSESRAHEGKIAPSLTQDKYVDLQSILDESLLFHSCDPTSKKDTVSDHYATFLALHARIFNLISIIRSIPNLAPTQL